MRRIVSVIGDNWRQILLSVAGLSLATVFLSYQLVSLTDGIAANEQPLLQAARQDSLSLGNILTKDALFLPHTLLHWLLSLLNIASPASLRFVSVLMGVVITSCLFIVLKRWHTYRIALLGTAIFLLSSWLLHTSRLMLSDIFLAALPVLIAAALWLDKAKKPKIAVFTFLLLIGFALYIPGFILFVAVLCIWKLRAMRTLMSPMKLQTKIAIGFTALLLLVPLVLNTIHDPVFVLRIAGLPTHIPKFEALIDNAYGIPRTLFWQTDPDPVRHLARLPYLDLFSVAMLVFGVYWYIAKFKLARARAMLACIACATVLVILGSVQLTILLPLMYLLITGGITLLLQQWFTVFPRNPIARNIGIGLMMVVVVLVGAYHVQRYFIAWPKAPETKQAFSIKV